MILEELQSRLNEQREEGRAENDGENRTDTTSTTTTNRNSNTDNEDEGSVDYSDANYVPINSSAADMPHSFSDVQAWPAPPLATNMAMPPLGSWEVLESLHATVSLPGVVQAPAPTRTAEAHLTPMMRNDL
jgi:hypothetical protein